MTGLLGMDPALRQQHCTLAGPTVMELGILERASGMPQGLPKTTELRAAAFPKKELYSYVAL